MQNVADTIRFLAIVEASILAGLLIALLFRSLMVAKHQAQAGIKFDASFSPSNLGLIIASYVGYLMGSILRTVDELGTPFAPSILINPIAGLLGIVGLWALLNFQNERIREIETVLKEANK